MCTVALQHGRAPTTGADWPYLYDALRDLGTAQMILDGRYPEDPIFLGETLWFNPLVGAVVAAGSWVSGLRPPEASVRLGPYLNLLVPLAFFLLAAALFGRWSALAALVFFVFGNAQDGALWTVATYSPWLYAPHFALFLFCLALLAYWKARQADRWIGYALTGLLLGLTFLAHAGPAVIGGAIILLTTTGRLLGACQEMWHSRPRLCGEEQPKAAMRRTLFQFLLLMGCALAASAPYLYSVLWHYHLHTLNSFPSLYTDEVARLSHLPELLRGAWSLSGALAIAGLAAALVQLRRDAAARWVLCWACVVLGLLVQTYLWQWAGWAREQVPQLVPGHHWLIAWSLLKALLCGCGLVALSQTPVRLYRRLHARAARGNASRGTAWAGSLYAAAAVLVAGGMLVRAYPSWIECAQTPRERVSYPRIYDDRARVYDWILRHTEPADVFLCDDQLGLIVVMPAARKLVGTMLIFSNPYVDSLARFADREAMFDALRAKDQPRFDRLADAYGVTFILTHGRETQLVEAAAFAHVREIFQAGLLRLYRVDSAGGSGIDRATRNPRS